MQYVILYNNSYHLFQDTRSPTRTLRSDGKSAASKISTVGTASVQPQPSGSVVPQKVERSVDEIIASLQDGSMADV